ncbi:MAG: WD40 repeat domain-containing protein [Bacillota bacterium]
MRNKRGLLVWVGIGVLFLGPAALLMTKQRSKLYDRFREDAWALSQPPLAIPADEGRSVLKDGPIGVVQPFEGLGKVQWVAVAPDGRSALFGNGNSFPQRVDLQTRKALGSPFGGAQGAAACFSPDSKRAVVAASWNMVYHFDTTTPSSMPLIGNMYSQTGQMRSLAVAPNGNTAATGGIDRSIWIWNLKTNKELGHLYLPGAIATSATIHNHAVAYSADGSQLFSAGHDGVLCCWDIRSGNLLYSRAVHDGRVTSVAFSKGGEYIGIGGEDKIVRVEDIATRKLVWKFEAQGAVVQQIEFSRDGRRLLTQSFDDVALWDIATGRKLGSIRIQGLGNPRITNQPIAALHPDGRHVIVGGDKPGIVTMIAAEATTKPTPGASTEP